MYLLYLQNENQNSVVQPLENHYFEKFSPGPTTVGHKIDTGYTRMSYTSEVLLRVQTGKFVFCARKIYSRAEDIVKCARLEQPPHHASTYVLVYSYCIFSKFYALY